MLQGKKSLLCTRLMDVLAMLVVYGAENNGGFASVRTRNIEPAADLAAYEGLTLRVRSLSNHDINAILMAVQAQLRCSPPNTCTKHPQVKGNGLRFKCIVRTESNWDGIAYCRLVAQPPCDCRLCHWFLSSMCTPSAISCLCRG